MKHYDLVILGAGSGNMILTEELAHMRTAIVEPGRFGGTCLNRGCIPTKMFVVAADAAAGARSAARLGVHARVDRVDWKGIRDRIFDRIDPLHESAATYRREQGVDVYSEPARFVAPKVLQVGDEQLTAEAFVISVGSRPVIPQIRGLDDVPYHTSDTIMRIDELPDSLLIVGGGFIAAEFGHVFGSFGSRVTIVQRGPRLLPAEDEQVSARFTELAGRRHQVVLNCEVTSVERSGAGVRATLARPGGDVTVDAAMLLLCVGRRSNSDLVDAAAGGLELDTHGHLATDATYATTVPGIWALGDVANHFQLKHMANAEARIVQHNLVHPESPRSLARVNGIAPHAVFTDPQIGSIGLTEQAARAEGIDHVVGVRDFSDAAYGWALEDTTSFVKIVVDPKTRTLLGAHIIGPQAAILIHPLIQAMTFGQTVDEIGRDVLFVHPALTEVVEQVLLEI